MSHFLSTISAASICIFLTACGGDGNSDTKSSTDTKLLPYAPYAIGSVRSAPADGTTISGIVRLEISGYYLSNVQLLPAQGGEPTYGKFNNIDGYEFEVDSGILDFDTTKLPNGPLQVRITAFDPTRNNQEVEIMSPRTWNISNAGTSAALSVSGVTSPANGATISSTTRLEVRGTGLANVELLPATGYSPKLGVFNISADRTHAWLDLDTRSLPDGVRTARISAFNVMAGQPGATEVVAMPPRQWAVRNGTDPNFTANVLMAPVHGETVTGKIKLEIRGTGIQNVELLPANGYSPKFGTFTVFTPKDTAYLEFDPNTLPAGVHEFRISAFNRPAGAADAQEIVVMPARQWNIRY